VVAKCSRSSSKTAPEKGNELLNLLGHTLPQHLMIFSTTRKLAGQHDCDPVTPHGFYTIDNSVVAAIAAWIRRGGTLIPEPLRP
jgi:hypothetical protein